MLNRFSNLHKKRRIARIVSYICCFSFECNNIIASDNLGLINNTNYASSRVADCKKCSIQYTENSNKLENTPEKDVSGDILFCEENYNDIDFISFKKFDALREEILLSLFKYRRDHEQNTYNISGTWNRCVSARFKNGDVVNRMVECYDLFEKEGEHRVSCWDCVLANFYYIKKYVFPKCLSENQISRLKMGMVTYLIPISMGLANHVFSYIYIDGYLLIFDPIEGTAAEAIDFNFANRLMGSYDGIRKQIEEFYETLSYTIAYERELDEGIKKYYEINCRLLDIFNFFGRTNGKYGEMTSYFSEDIMNSDHKLSNLKWMLDSEFFTFLANKGTYPMLGYFEDTNPGIMFG